MAPTRPLLLARGVEKAFGDRLILKGCDLSIAPGDRIGLVGVNGCGKSTLLSILADAQPSDGGTIERRGSLGYLAQEPDLPFETVGAAIDDALAWHSALLADYERALERGDLDAAAPLQDRLDQVGWDLSHRGEAIRDQLNAPPRERQIHELSGGERRRVAMARALLGMPDLLLLDEPTNHLDMETAEWLQAFLSGYRGAVALVTHDRYLLEAVAEQIIEVEDGRTVAYEGSYADYLISRAERRASMEKAEERRLETIAREAAWAARSPAARTTKQRARLKRLEALQAQGRLKAERSFSMDLSTGTRQGRTLLEVHGVSGGYDGPLFRDLEISISPGDRIGVIGPNGAGKSTLLKVLTGALEPLGGQLYRAPKLSPAVLDQKRSGLDPTHTVYEAAGDGNSHVWIGDHPVHVITFLERFLFERGFLDQKVAALSGGERARLLLARLLLQGANLIILDEPTNDLDLQTLRILEDALLAFDGAALIVTHDRAFLDRVCTRILALEGNERVTVYGDRLQYLRARDAEAKAAAEAEAVAAAEAAAKAAPKAAAPARQKLSFKERREFESMEGTIEAREADLSALEATLADPDTYTLPGEEIAALAARLESLGSEIEALYARWSELEARA